MITCTRCGHANDDRELVCVSCGKKIQSCHYVPPVEEERNQLERLNTRQLPPDVWRNLKRMAEAWAYLTLLGAVAAGCWHYRVWWPLYPAVAVIGLIMWVRRV